MMACEKDPRIDGTEVATKAISNQFETMCHEKWLAENRIRALKAEIAARGIVIEAVTDALMVKAGLR